MNASNAFILPRCLRINFTNVRVINENGLSTSFRCKRFLFFESRLIKHIIDVAAYVSKKLAILISCLSYFHFLYTSFEELLSRMAQKERIGISTFGWAFG